MKQILIGKQIAYAAKVGGGTISGINELNLLDTGAIACFAEDNTILTAAGVATELADKKRIYIAVGNQVDVSRSFLSTLIPRSGVDYSKKAYTAPVLQKKFVGYDGTTAGTELALPATLEKGDEGQITIVNTTSGMRTIGTDIKRYTNNILAGETDGDAFIERLVAQINADPDRIVNAVEIGTSDGISLEAIDGTTTFEVSVSGILENASIVEKGAAVEGVAVAPVFGEGTYDQVLALEDEYSVGRGDTNRLELRSTWYSNHSLATSGLTYNIYTISWMGKRNHNSGEQATYIHEVKIAIPSSGTAPTTAFETIMAEAFAGYASTSDAETGA